MKLLRSPWVSGVLVVIAIVVVAYQFVPLHWQSAVVGLAQAVAAAPDTSNPKAPVAAETPAAELPDLPPVAIERQLIEARFPQWADAPRRDPFRLVPIVSDKPVHQYPSPVLVWKLKAIWRQTNGRIAAIDNRIYAEGDKVEGYRIQRIEADQVWFEGPDGPEALTFRQSSAGPAKKKP